MNERDSRMFIPDYLNHEILLDEDGFTSPRQLIKLPKRLLAAYIGYLEVRLYEKKRRRIVPSRKTKKPEL